MADFIIIVILLAVTVSIILYLVRGKKRGEVCIGCPYAKQCNGKCGGQKS